MIMNIDIYKVKVQRKIVSVSIFLLVSKFAAFFLTNSVGVLTDAMESIVNVVAGLVSLYSLYFASKPKDEDHPFGHGKVELISASLEGLLIMVAGGIIIFEGVKRFFVPAELRQLDIGIWIVAGAGLINYLLGWYSIHVGKKHDSIALVAGGKHLHSDTYSSIGLVLGLVLLYFTKMGWIDSSLAILFGGIILVTGVRILRETIGNLMDKADNQILQVVSDLICKKRKIDWVDVHNLKVVKYGSMFHIDCDLTLPWYYNIRESHRACEDLEKAIGLEFADRIQLSIHSDPCRVYHCTYCQVEACPHRVHPFTKQLDFTVEQITKNDEDNRNGKLNT